MATGRVTLVLLCGAAVCLISAAALPQSLLIGQVTDAATGNAIAGATVTLTQGGQSRTSTTDAKGQYQFDNVRDGTVDIRVTHALYADTVRERVLETIQRKIDGQDITADSKPESGAKIIDLMDALKQSLAAAKPASEKSDKEKKGRKAS